MKRFIGFVLVLAMIFPAAYAVSPTDTLGDVENEVIAYLAEAHPEIDLHTTEYVCYLVDQLCSNADKDLENHVSDYDAFCTYASEYVIYAETPADEFSGLPAEILQKTAAERENELAIAAIEREEKVQAMLASNESTTYELGYYNPLTAARYAIQHSATSNYNKNYPNYHSGGDCTNFVSQCLVAGGISMSFSPTPHPDLYDTTDYWYHYYNDDGMYYYNYTTSWIRVDDLYVYLVGHRHAVSMTYTLNNVLQQAKVGDIIQISRNGGNSYYHSYIVSSCNNGVRICAHTTDRTDELLRDAVAGESNLTYRIIRPYYA